VPNTPLFRDPGTNVQVRWKSNRDGGKKKEDMEPVPGIILSYDDSIFFQINVEITEKQKGEER